MRSLSPLYYIKHHVRRCVENMGNNDKKSDLRFRLRVFAEEDNEESGGKEMGNGESGGLD